MATRFGCTNIKRKISTNKKALTMLAKRIKSAGVAYKPVTYLRFTHKTPEPIM